MFNPCATIPGSFRKALYFIAFILSTGISLFAQPRINSVSPQSAPAGAIITLQGTGFSLVPSRNTVYVGNVQAEVVTATANMLQVKCNAIGTYSRISVTTDSLTAYSPLKFSSTFPGTVGISPSNFAPRQDFPIFKFTQQDGLADFDGDGKLDLAMTDDDASYKLCFLRNTSTKKKISFAPTVTLYAPVTTFKPAFADFNGDGKLDVALMGYFRTFSVYINTSSPGEISFAPFQSFVIGGSIGTDIIVADMDGDGRPDVLGQIVGQSTGLSSVCICRNTSSGSAISFQLPKEIIGYNMAIGDVNGDGKPELAVDNIVYANKSTPGNLQFTPVFTGIDSYAKDLTDIDGDGKLDFILSKEGYTTVYRNTDKDSIRFDAGTQIYTGTYQALGDMNGDGKPDFLGAEQNTPETKFLITVNQSTPGKISKGVSTRIDANTYLRSVTVGDLDGDGKADIITNNATTLSVHRNITGEPVIASSGTEPVAGPIFTDVTVDDTAPVYKGTSYVTRHYDIEPETNAANASATVTLSFSQQDFDAFNASPNHGMDLPTGPNDLNKRANFRIYQHHGTSASGVPGTYSGSVIEIDPDDSNIKWSDSLKAWQITFNITGFSGFFAGSTNIVALPLVLNSFKAAAFNKTAVLEWSSSAEINVKAFEIERSANGNDFTRIASVSSHGESALNSYHYIDIPPFDSRYFYRLRIVDEDGSFSFSKVSEVSFGKDVKVVVYPNPARNVLNVSVPSGEKTYLQLFTMTGELVKTVDIGRFATQVALDIKRIPGGNYQLVWSDGSRKVVMPVMIQN